MIYTKEAFLELLYKQKEEGNDDLLTEGKRAI